jgi:preprotein translocase subunit YajC
MTPIAAEAQQAGGLFGGNSMWVMILIYAVIIGGIYFFLIRPNSKKKKEEAQMRNSLEIGDEITTIGGIMGRVVTVKEDSLIIETGADRNKMKIARWAVSQNNTANEKAEAERQAAKEAAEAEKKAKLDAAAEEGKAKRKKSKKNKDDTFDE